MREIKFRFYSNHLDKFVTPDDSIFVGALKDPDMNPMQYTGLKDKNGVEIYEGDVVEKSNDFDYGKSRGMSSATSLVKKNILIEWNQSVHANGWNIAAGKKTIYKVIGNIYSTPELLENKSKKLLK